jgi:hypothetical protein
VLISKQQSYEQNDQNRYKDSPSTEFDEFNCEKVIDNHQCGFQILVYVIVLDKSIWKVFIIHCDIEEMQWWQTI